MYDELKDPAKTCKGVFLTGTMRWIVLTIVAIAYFVTAVVSGAFWIYYVYCFVLGRIISSQKAKKHPAVEKSVFEESKKRFHFATREDAKEPLLKAQF